MVQRTLFVLIGYLALSHSQSVHTNSIDDEGTVEDENPFMNVAASMLQNNQAADIGSMVSNLLQSEGGKQLGSLLLGAAQSKGDATGQILSGLGAMLGQNNAGAALDPALIGNVLGMLADQGAPEPQKPAQDDLGNLLNLAGQFLGNSGGNAANLVDLLPTVVQAMGAFTGPEAQRREQAHSDHAWMLPPLAEKVHVFLDHLAHSELGRSLWKKTGADKFFSMFSENGQFKASKMFEMLENHSFRRHWIKWATDNITNLLAFVSDPITHKQYISTITALCNSFLKTQGFPKSTHFDPSKPAESLTNLVNYFSSKYLNYKPDARQYVQPAVKYVQELISLAKDRGILRKKGINSKDLSNKITDTINLEILEPVIRVSRAYRFAKKVPECDKYVMCIVNQPSPNEVTTLPGLKNLLSKSSSLLGSWFLSSHTGTSFLTLYSAIMDEDNCKIRYLEKCNDFHAEEIKVTTEYNHNEL